MPKLVFWSNLPVETPGRSPLSPMRHSCWLRPAGGFCDSGLSRSFSGRLTLCESFPTFVPDARFAPILRGARSVPLTFRSKWAHSKTSSITSGVPERTRPHLKACQCLEQSVSNNAPGSHPACSRPMSRLVPPPCHRCPHDGSPLTSSSFTMTRHRARKPLGYAMCHRGTNEYKCIKPQSSRRTRRTETDLHSDPQSFDLVGQQPNVGIDQQSSRPTCEFEIREKPRLMD